MLLTGVMHSLRTSLLLLPQTSTVSSVWDRLKSRKSMLQKSTKVARFQYRSVAFLTDYVYRMRMLDYYAQNDTAIAKYGSLFRMGYCRRDFAVNSNAPR